MNKKLFSVKLKLFMVLCVTAITLQAMAQALPYTLTANGIGPVQIGTKAFDLPESVPQLYASMVSDVLFDGEMPDDEDMPEFATWYFYDDDGETVFTATSDSQGYITEIIVTSPNILTAEGLHVGAPRRQIEALEGVQKIDANPLADYPQDVYLLNGATINLDSYYAEDGLIGQDVIASISISDPVLTPDGLGIVRLGIKADDLPDSTPRLYASRVQAGKDWHYLDEQGKELFIAKQDDDGLISEITVTAPSIKDWMGLYVGMPLQQVEYISGLQLDKPHHTEDTVICYSIHDITFNFNKRENQGIDKAASLVASMTVVGAPSSDDLYMTVNNVIAEALPYYLTSSSLQEMESHLDEISSIKSVERAYSNGITTLFVDIKNAGPISFSFYPDETTEVSAASLEELRNHLKPIPEEYTGKQWHNKFTIAFQMGDDGGFKSTKDLLELAASMFKNCNLDGELKLTKPTIDFFLNDMYDNDYVFLNTHGYYDKEERKHWLLTSTDAGVLKPIKIESQERIKAITEDQSINDEEKKRLINEVLKDEINRINENLVTKIFFSRYEDLYRKGEIMFALVKERRLGLATHWTSWINGEVSEFKDKQICYVAVSEDLIRNSDKHFIRPTIIFNSACQSLMGYNNTPNYSLADAFLQRGAGAYLGFDETNIASRHGGLEFFGRLFSGMSINRAYETLDDIILNNRMVSLDKKREWTAHLKKRCVTIIDASDSESNDFGDYGTYRPILSNLKWYLSDQHIHLAAMATIPLHWFTTKQMYEDIIDENHNKITIVVRPEENTNIEDIPLEYGFEIGKTADFKEKTELGRVGIKKENEDKFSDGKKLFSYKITSSLEDNMVIYGLGYINKITDTYFGEADTCCLRAFVFDGKNYTYSKYIVLRRNVRGQSYLGELPDLVTQVYNKAVNAGMDSGNHNYPVDSEAYSEYLALSKETGKRIQEIKNQYIGKRIPVEGGKSITHAVIEDIRNPQDRASTSIYLRLYPSSVVANAHLGINSLYFVFLDDENKLLDSTIAGSDIFDGRIIITLDSIGSRTPSKWNRFAKILQVTKEEYHKWEYGY